MRRSEVARRWALGLAALTVVCVLLIAAAFPGLAWAAGSYDAKELQFLQLINDYRAQNGLQPLLLSDAASDASAKHSHDMGTYNFFDHNTVQSDWFVAGATPWVRMAQCGYNYNTSKGENIAAGYPSAEAVFTGWKNSPGHDANMRNASFKVIGIGLENIPGSTYGSYWTTDFGGYVDPTAHPGGTTVTTVPSTTTTVRVTTTTARVTTTTARATTTTTAGHDHHDEAGHDHYHGDDTPTDHDHDRGSDHHDDGSSRHHDDDLSAPGSDLQRRALRTAPSRTRSTRSHRRGSWAGTTTGPTAPATR